MDQSGLYYHSQWRIYVDEDVSFSTGYGLYVIDNHDANDVDDVEKYCAVSHGTLNGTVLKHWYQV